MIRMLPLWTVRIHAEDTAWVRPLKDGEARNQSPNSTELEAFFSRKNSTYTSWSINLQPGRSLHGVVGCESQNTWNRCYDPKVTLTALLFSHCNVRIIIQLLKECLLHILAVLLQIGLKMQNKMVIKREDKILTSTDELDCDMTKRTELPLKV